jgi:hypothetical protein
MTRKVTPKLIAEWMLNRINEQDAITVDARLGKLLDGRLLVVIGTDSLTKDFVQINTERIALNEISESLLTNRSSRWRTTI